ncbi:enoyl-CoA hydratase/isomerase family protein [Sporosarcina gallistercoris]|uniref:Enoyl-CoA hydratase/isomerase family protein n=1 Tax=Sporosarcina gallistercoris TaxID=2762245 RepID=A0ABR8PGC5_9BACL|nr:enoyl-CoA hydratase/isomerase family protein [Sporosarcina gallistercoris]MBD7907226.1 enoyl-CoA hydratase/isomerase family protein [Sporosarcina gallistercoris]
MPFNITSVNGVVTFTINRPEVRNAVNHEVIEGLEQFINLIESDRSVRWGIIASEGGRAFCSGGDLGEFHALETSAQALPMLSRMTELLYRLATLPAPTIALMDGAAVGGGCEIAAACDYRLMQSGAKAGFVQGTLAITTGWGGASLLYEKEFGHSQVIQLLTESRVHTAEELVEWGWITDTYSGDKQVALDRFLAKFAHIESSVLQAYKTVAIRKWKQSDLKSRMMDECKHCSILWESHAHHEAVRRFRDRT